MSVRDSLTRFRPEALFLWAFFLALIVFGVWVSAMAQRANEQRNAVAAIKDFDPRSSVTYDYQLDADGMAISGGRPLAPDWLQGIFGIDFFCRVVGLTVDGVTEERLAEVAHLRRLKVLSLSLTGAGANDVHVGALLRELPDLKRLSLQFGDRFRSFGADDALLKQIGTMTALQQLTLELGDPVTQAGVAHLADLRGLRLLALIGSYGSELTSFDELGSLKEISVLKFECFPLLTAAGLSFLADLPLLKSFGLDRCCDVSLAELPVLKTVEEFEFEEGRPISDADLEHLADFPAICILRLACPMQTECVPMITFSDRGLSALDRLKKLQVLQFGNYDSSHVTAAAAEALERTHPGLRVEM
jgi:hypothetical protein